MQCSQARVTESVDGIIFPEDGWVPIHAEDKPATKKKIRLRRSRRDVQSRTSCQLKMGSKSHGPNSQLLPGRRITGVIWCAWYRLTQNT